MAVTHDELTDAINQCLVEQGYGGTDIDAGHIATGVMELLDSAGHEVLWKGKTRHHPLRWSDDEPGSYLPAAYDLDAPADTPVAIIRVDP